jgi:hypothetical protein
MAALSQGNIAVALKDFLPRDLSVSSQKVIIAF